MCRFGRFALLGGTLRLRTRRRESLSASRTALLSCRCGRPPHQWRGRSRDRVEFVHATEREADPHPGRSAKRVSPSWSVPSSPNRTVAPGLTAVDVIDKGPESSTPPACSVLCTGLVPFTGPPAALEGAAGLRMCSLDSFPGGDVGGRWQGSPCRPPRG